MSPKEKLREKLNELQYQSFRETNRFKWEEIQGTIKNLQEIIYLIEKQEKETDPQYKYDY